MDKKVSTSADDLRLLQEILNETDVVKTTTGARSFYWRNEKPKTFDQRMKAAETRIHEAKADDAEGDIVLKKIIARAIISILVLQTVVIFYIAISQGAGALVYPKWPIKFHLEEWNFRILITGTLIETYYLMRIVVTYLFPKRSSK